MKIYNCDKYERYYDIGLIPHNILEFSDSQKQITVDLDSYYGENHVKIISRMSWKDLQDIILAVKSLKRAKVDNIYLDVPYFLGARSDRLFEKNSTHYLKDIICPIINSLEFNTVSVLDSHSYVLEACLRNYNEMDIKPFYGWFIEKAIITSEDKQNTFIIAPDYGAVKRTSFFVKNYGFEKMISCSKNRDIHTGKILDVTIPIDNFEGKNCIILDDICDGGTTFRELAKGLKERNVGKITLIVTHCIHKNGINNVLQYVDRIYTTNSVDNFTFLSEEKGFTSLFQYKVIE